MRKNTIQCGEDIRPPEQNTPEQIKKVRSHPWISKDVPVRGFIFDVDTGLLREVAPTG